MVLLHIPLKKNSRKNLKNKTFRNTTKAVICDLAFYKTETGKENIRNVSLNIKIVFHRALALSVYHIDKQTKWNLMDK